MLHNLHCGFQWPMQFGYFDFYYDGPIKVIHLGPFYIEWGDGLDRWWVK